MLFKIIIILLFFVLVVVCVLRPIFILYLFASLPILYAAPKSPQSGFLLANLGNMNIYVLDALILLMLIVMLCKIYDDIMMKKGVIKKTLKNPIVKSLICLFLWSTVLGYLSYSKGFDLQNVLRSISAELIMFITILMLLIKDINTKKSTFMKYTIFLGLVMVLFAFIKYYITNEIEVTSSGTLRTLLGNDVVVIMFPLCYILFSNNSLKIKKKYLFIIVAILFFGINFTGHRSGWVVLIFILFVYLISLRLKIVEYIWIPIILFSAFFFVVIIVPRNQIAKGEYIFGDMIIRVSDTFNIENNTTQERLSKWSYSYNILKENPLLGLGRHPVYTDFVDESNKKTLDKFGELNRAPHNMFANVAVHQGVIGLLVIIYFIYNVLVYIKNIHVFDVKFKFFVKIYILSFMLFSMFNTSFTSPVGKIYFFISLGLIVSEEYRFDTRKA